MTKRQSSDLSILALQTLIVLPTNAVQLLDDTVTVRL
jgi:hypothetical protein